MEDRTLEYLSQPNRDLAAGPDREHHRSDGSIDQLVGQRTRILKTKLEVFAAEIAERLSIRSRNLQSLIYDDLTLSNALRYFDPTSGIGLFQASFPERLYAKRFDIGKERREQDVECWKDVSMVMRDFLVAWESLEQARARALFLNDDRDSNQGNL